MSMYAPTNKHPVDKDFFADPPPWDHQREAVIRSTTRDTFGLFFEMGTGKTRTVIDILRYKYLKEGKVIKTLVLTPLSVVNQFAKEFETYGGELFGPKNVLAVNRSTGDARLRQMMLSQAKIIVLNHESLNINAIRKWLMEWEPVALVVDEAHRFKTHNSIRTKYLLGLCDGRYLGNEHKVIKGKKRKVFTTLDKTDHKIKYRFILTGTPILRSIEDLWSQFEIFGDDSPFPDNFYSYRNVYMKNINANWAGKKSFPKWVPDAGAMEKLNEIIHNLGMRVRKDKAIDLPPLVRTRRDVPMTREQEQFYAQMEEHLVAMFEDERNGKINTMSASIALTKTLRLAQLVCGIFVNENTGEVSTFNHNRLKILEDIILDIPDNQKFIIWTNFAQTYKPIGELMEKLKIKHGFITGRENLYHKQAAMEGLNDPANHLRCIIANQAAGGTGVNLTGASIAIYYSRGFSLGDDLQSEARNYRGGSEIHKKITRIDLVCPQTVDEIILDGLKSKLDMAEMVLKIKEKLKK